MKTYPVRVQRDLYSGRSDVRRRKQASFNDAAQAIERYLNQAMEFLFIPPYSPVLNFTERVFAKLNTLLRKAGPWSAEARADGSTSRRLHAT